MFSENAPTFPTHEEGGRGVNMGTERWGRGLKCMGGIFGSCWASVG